MKYSFHSNIYKPKISNITMKRGKRIFIYNCLIYQEDLKSEKETIL